MTVPTNPEAEAAEELARQRLAAAEAARVAAELARAEADRIRNGRHS